MLLVTSTTNCFSYVNCAALSKHDIDIRFNVLTKHGTLFDLRLNVLTKHGTHFDLRLNVLAKHEQSLTSVLMAICIFIHQNQWSSH